MNLFKNKISIKAFIAIISVVIILSCSSKTKEKELPSYFCNENLERYFAGNDSLPVININPNDSFGVIRSVIDSLESSDDYFSTYSFNTYITIDSSFKPILFRINIVPHLSMREVIVKKTFVFKKKNLLGIDIINESTYKCDEDTLSDIQLKDLIKKFITNYGRNPFLSDNPNRAVVCLYLSKKVSQKQYSHLIKSVIEGYTNILDSISVNKFNKPLCSLDKKESTIISEMIPLGLIIGYQHDRQYNIEPSHLLEM